MTHVVLFYLTRTRTKIKTKIAAATKISLPKAGRYVFNSVCLFVCLSARLLEKLSSSSSIYLSTSTINKKNNKKQLENILAKWPTQGLKNRLRVASRI